MSLLKNHVVRMAIVIALFSLVLNFVGCNKERTPTTEEMPAAQGAAKPAAQETIAQKTCPVTGEPIDKNVYTEYKGKKVYFCCKKCIAAFKKNPEKYLAKLEGKEKAEVKDEAETEGEHAHGEHK